MEFLDAQRNVHVALAVRRSRREERSLPVQDWRTSGQSVKELFNVLDECDTALCEKLAKVLKDCTVTRVYISDLEIEPLTSFFGSAVADHSAIDQFRAWLRNNFSTHIRLVGDPRYAGYALEFES